jgi:predicted chitinase
MAAEEKVNIPSFSYPFKNIKKEKDCYDNLENKADGNYLFSQKGLWHGGMHFDGSFDKEIRAIADGELVAYRINQNYLYNDDETKKDDGTVETGLYSTGFFLLKHTLAYPKTNKLTFFSLYMHTAKKDEYNLDTHKVKGTDRFLRKGVSYDDPDKLEELAVDTKITIDPNQTTEEKDKHRYKVLYVGDTKRTDGATIHKSNIQALDNTHKLKTITKDTEAKEAVQFPTQKIDIKAGEMIGLRGVYTPAKQNKNEVTHIEVFSADDIQTFADKAKEEYAKKDSEGRPYPKEIVIPKNTTLYELKDQQIVKSSDGIATVKAYTTADGTTTCTNAATRDALTNGMEIEVDTSTKVCNNKRYTLTKIEKKEGDNYTMEDVSSNNWSIWHKSIGTKKVPRKKETEPKTQVKELTLKLKDLKKIFYRDKKYVHIDDDTLVLYEKCKEHHPIEFNWAKTIKDTSQDKFSILEDITPLIIKEGELKMSSMYSELFSEMDKLVDDPNDKLESQEISEAAKNLKVKKLTAKMIVQHSSEWDKTTNMADGILKILDQHKDKLDKYDELKEHYNNQKTRIENLEFFSQCTSIEGFPTSDSVYHFNPIELVAELQQCRINANSFFDEYNKQFSTEKLTNKVKKNLQILFKGVSKFYTEHSEFICDKRKLAYAFATARLETNKTFGSVSEAYWTSASYRKKYFEEMYDPVLGKNDSRKKIAKELGNTIKGDGVKYHGRGFCQLTGKNNYIKAGDFLGLDLLNNPELAKSPIDNAIQIILYGMHIGMFTKKKFSDYINDTTTDYYNARRIINGLDRAKDIQGFAKKLEKCFEKAI